MKNISKLPTKEKAKEFLEIALANKLLVPAEARKIYTNTINKLHTAGLLEKTDLDRYSNLTKSKIREK